VERVTAWAEKRTAPVVASVSMLVLVMAWSLLGHSILHGGPAKLLSPSDLWSLAASSSAIAHGHFSHIYAHNGALTSPPALVGALAVAHVAGGWGHPEDCVALALVVWAAIELERHGRAGGPRAALVASMVLGDRRVHHIALWWSAVMATLAVMLLSTGPSPRCWVALALWRRRPAPAGNLECEAMVEPLGAVGRRE
jgi:hypothetical protein